MDILRSTRQAVLALDSGMPAVSIHEVFTGVVPRHSLMEPWLPYATVVAYLLAKPALNSLSSAMNTSGRSLPFRAFTLVHNLLLCLYSTWTASNVLPLTISHIRRNGTLSVYCSHALWEDGLGYWGFLFYLSKTWELVDTFLLIVKRRRPSYLQVYHHAMTILCAYWLQVSHAPVMFLFVGLNASIHSVMYLYYALTTVGVRLGAKSLITSAQIGQFVVGIVLATPTFFLKGGACSSPAQKFAVVAIIAHAFYLIKLFGEFYKNSYSPKKVS